MHYQPGDVVARRKGLVMHRGLVLRDGRVLHNTPFTGEHASAMEDFRQGQRLHVEQRDTRARRAALARADRYGRDTSYNLLYNNCEHTVTRLTDGRAHSPQLKSWLLGAVVGAATLALTRHPGWASATAGAAYAWMQGKKLR